MMFLPLSLVMASLWLGSAKAFAPAAAGIFAAQRCRGGPAHADDARTSLVCSDRCVVGGGDDLPGPSSRCPRFDIGGGFGERFLRRYQGRTRLALRSRGDDVQTGTGSGGNDPPPAPAAKSGTKIDDGSPLGVAIVLLGGSWVVFGGQDVQLPSGISSLLGSIDNVGGDSGTDVRIWAVFGTASVAAGISRLVRYYWDKSGE